MLQLAIVILLTTEVVFGVIAAALAGSAKHDIDNLLSSFQYDFAFLLPSGWDDTLIFVAFTGASAAAIAIVSAVRRLTPWRRSKLGGFIELTVYFIWAVFWLAAVIALATRDKVFDCPIDGNSICQKLNAAWAFSFLAFLVWLASIAVISYGLFVGQSDGHTRPAGPPPASAVELPNQVPKA